MPSSFFRTESTVDLKTVFVPFSGNPAATSTPALLGDYRRMYHGAGVYHPVQTQDGRPEQSTVNGPTTRPSKDMIMINLLMVFGAPIK
jgi:hypothetical protein